MKKFKRAFQEADGIEGEVKIIQSVDLKITVRATGIASF